MKSWLANLIFIVVEILLIFISFIIGKDAIDYALNGDFVEYLNEMENMINYVQVVGVAFVVMSILFLAIKPIRTKLTCFLSICNIISFLVQMWLMHFI